MRKYDWNEDKLRDAVATSLSFSETLRCMGIPLSGNNASTLKRKIELYSLDISHFTFSPRKTSKRKSLDEYLTSDSSIDGYELKNRLLKAGYKSNICEVCGTSDWNGKPLSMQIHHKDGNNKNNCLDNLMMICPNCHSQTENYRGKSNKVKDKVANYCQDCGREIGLTSTRCRRCAAEHRLGQNAKITMTIDEFRQYKKMGYSNTRIAKIYSVTEFAIRKWRKRRGL